jgi:L-ascorbate metabolism protein UlaG (beta-lactamase superfamily)
MLHLSEKNLQMATIQRLNRDNSWAITIGATTFLVDPWLRGREVDYFGWFNTQWHREAPVPPGEVPAYDWVIVTQQFPDHFHTETLLELGPGRLIVPPSVRKKAESLFPDAIVESLDNPVEELVAGGARVRRFRSTALMPPHFDAYALYDGEETIFLAPHGYTFRPKELEQLRQLPPVTLLLAPANYLRLPFFLGGTIMTGIAGLEKLLKDTNAACFVNSHDGDKHATGLVPVLSREIRYTPADFRKNEFLATRYREVGYEAVVLTA